MFFLLNISIYWRRFLPVFLRVDMSSVSGGAAQGLSSQGRMDVVCRNFNQTSRQSTWKSFFVLLHWKLYPQHQWPSVLCINNFNKLQEHHIGSSTPSHPRALQHYDYFLLLTKHFDLLLPILPGGNELEVFLEKIAFVRWLPEG